MKINKVVLLRYLGNIFLLVGYFILLWKDLKFGLLIKCIGGVLTIPFAYKLRLYDVLFLSGFFTIIELSKLIDLFF